MSEICFPLAFLIKYASDIFDDFLAGVLPEYAQADVLPLGHEVVLA